MPAAEKILPAVAPPLVQAVPPEPKASALPPDAPPAAPEPEPEPPGAVPVIPATPPTFGRSAWHRRLAAPTPAEIEFLRLQQAMAAAEAERRRSAQAAQLRGEFERQVGEAFAGTDALPDGECRLAADDAIECSPPELRRHLSGRENLLAGLHRALAQGPQVPILRVAGGRVHTLPEHER